jgi:acetyl-CoA carboxylase carboxyltransferase component
MAKVILEPIGQDLRDADVRPGQRERMAELESRLQTRRAEVRAGWGEKYHARVRAKGKMTAWDRVEYLADAPEDIRPIGTFVNYGETFGGENGRTSPAAGVVTAFVRVEGRWVVCISNDNTVASGSWWPRSPEKIIRAQEIALRLKVPVVYLVDCSGLFLPEQGRAFPGPRGAGHIFTMNARLSDAGVPQIAGVFGDCIAGGGYMPIISDRVYMTEQAYMVIAGAALIQGAKSQNLSSLDIGGADVHVHLSNCADERAPDDPTCLDFIRQEVSRTCSSAVPFYRGGVDPVPPAFEASELADLIPVEATAPYDARQAIARLVDDSLFYEVLHDRGQEVITGVARVSGLYVGICANYQGLFDHPHQPGRKRAGGILYREGVAKLAAFSRACNDDGIPLIWLQDISGFDIGTEAEKQGLLGYGSSLIHANSNNSVPMITVLMRKASGAGYYAMAGMPYDPVLQLSTPVTRLAVMEGKTLAIGAYRTKLDDQFEIMATDPDERAAVAAGMKAVEDRIEADMDPYASARQMDTDEIVPLGEVRAYLETMVEMSYQASGVRRVKNPRIWSLHDLEVLR